MATEREAFIWDQLFLRFSTTPEPWVTRMPEQRSVTEWQVRDPMAALQLTQYSFDCWKANRPEVDVDN